MYRIFFTKPRLSFRKIDAQINGFSSDFDGFSSDFDGFSTDFGYHQIFKLPTLHLSSETVPKEL